MDAGAIQEMNLGKIGRVPARILADRKIIKLAENWKDILSAKMGNGRIDQIRLRNGVVLNAPPEVDLNFLFHEIWIEEFYAPAGYEIGPGQAVVDIGANIGVFAAWAATKAPGVKVLSFEPFPENARYFRQNQDESKLTNVEFHAAAVGANNGTRRLQVSDSWILHSLANKDSSDGIEVDCVSLDSALADIESCDLLKLDCEGGEYEILYSASPSAIAKIRRIVCEYNVLDGHDRNGKGLSDFLSRTGFRIDGLTELDPTSGFLCARRS